MKGHRLQLGALLLAIASIGAYGILPASASGPAPLAPARVTVFSVDTNAVVASWPKATVPSGGSAVTSYTITPTPACGGCAGLTTAGGLNSRITGLTNGTPYTFTVHASNGTAGPESPASASVTPAANGSTCQFDSFPAVPGGSSELAVGCSLSTDIGGAGNDYKIEDFPQAQWHTGAGRPITVMGATTGATIVATSAAHFGSQDINDTIAGTGVPSNTFVVKVNSATSIVLNHAVGTPGVANGAVLTLDNSDGRTITDGLSPATTVTGGSTAVAAVTTHVTTAVNSFPAGGFTLHVTGGTIPSFPATGTTATGTLSIVTTTPAATDKFTYATTNSGANEFLTVKHVAGQGTGTKIASGAAVTLIPYSQTATTLKVTSTATLPSSGHVTVPTASPAGTAVLGYTSGGGGGTLLSGVSLTSGTSGTIASGAAVHQATSVSALGGNLAIANGAGFSAGGSATLKTTDSAGATIAYTGGGNVNGATTLTGVTLSSGTGYVSTSSAVSAIDSFIINSATGHFCAPGINPTTCDAGGNQKNDTGRGISGTRIPPGTTIQTVVSSTQIQLDTKTIACPTGVTTCGQLGISAVSNLTTSRLVQDATFMTSPNRVCSATALFLQTDVNQPITSALILSTAVPPRVDKLGAGRYITGLASGCPVDTTGVNVSGAAFATGGNPNVVIGGPNSTAAKNGDAVMSLSSELSVSPTLAPGEPDCSFGTPVGSNLVGKWLNPASTDVKSLGTLPNPSVTGPVIGQLDVITGTGNPAFAGYAVLATSANSPGDSNAPDHVDLVFPALLTGTAVCPAPSTVGVATVFRFFGETLSQSAAGNGDVRELKTPTTPLNDNAYEHIIQNPSVSVFDATGVCAFEDSTTGPNSAGFDICHGK